MNRRLVTLLLVGGAVGTAAIAQASSNSGVVAPTGVLGSTPPRAISQTAESTVASWGQDAPDGASAIRPVGAAVLGSPNDGRTAVVFEYQSATGGRCVAGYLASSDGSEALAADNGEETGVSGSCLTPDQVSKLPSAAYWGIAGMVVKNDHIFFGTADPAATSIRAIVGANKANFDVPLETESTLQPGRRFWFFQAAETPVDLEVLRGSEVIGRVGLGE